ncbi:MAG: PQQ-binding-like beta-propeller repeat protein [Cellulosilyticaceae bacterium]
MRKGIKRKIQVLMLGMILLLVGCTQKVSQPIGTVLWTFETGDKILSSPVIFKNTAIFGSNDKNLYCVDLKKQEEKWRYTCEEEVTTKPMINGEQIIFSTHSGCYAVDAKTGEEIWTFKKQPTGKAIQDRWDYHAPSPILYKELVIFTSVSGSIHGLDSKTGEVVWEYTPETTKEIRATPIVEGDVLYFGDSKGNCVALDLNTKEILWQTSIGRAIIASQYAYGDYVYFTGRDTKVVALDAKDGSEKWQHTDPDGSWFTTEMFVANDILYVGGSDNKKLLAFNAETGDIQNTFISEQNIFGTPIIEDGILYFCDGNAYFKQLGNVFAYDVTKSEEPLWQVEFKFPIFSGPVIKDGVMYFGGTDGNFYAMQAK